MSDDEFGHLPPKQWSDSAVLENQALALTGVGSFIVAMVTNTGAAVRYFQLFDQTAALTGAEVPLTSVAIAAGDAKLVSLGRRGREFVNGIRWGLSTTAPTFTNPAGAEGFVSLAFDDS